jgi:serine/threonine-protein kinase
VDVGATVAGRFVVEGRIGRGGMGEVLSAHDRELGRPVALKVLPEGEHDADAFLRLRQEARALAAVRHPGIVAVYDVVRDGGSLVIVMERLEGSGLDAAIERDGTFAPVRAIEVGSAILEALDAVHAAGIVHRDLKPSNVFLDRPGHGPERVRVLDFGIAQLRAGESLVETRTGMLLGSLLYMAPEQVRDPRGASLTVDLWAVGAILFECLAGRPPLVATSAAEAVAKLLADPVPRIGDVVPSVPAGLARVIDRALSKAPEERHGSAREMREALLGARASCRNDVVDVLGATGDGSREPGAASTAPLPPALALPSIDPPVTGRRPRGFAIAAIGAVALEANTSFAVLTAEHDERERADVVMPTLAPDVAPPAAASAPVPPPSEPPAPREVASAAPVAAGRERDVDRSASAAAHAPATPAPAERGHLVVLTEEGTEVTVEGGPTAIARFRRAGETARAELDLVPGHHRVSCRIPHEMDPVRIEVDVQAGGESRARCLP